MIDHLDPAIRRQFVHETLLPHLHTRPFLDGIFQSGTGQGEALIRIFDPMTEEMLAEIPSANQDDIDIAVSAARIAYDSGGWKQMHPRKRAAFLFRLADLIERDCVPLALLEAADTGRLYCGVRDWDIPHAALVYRYYAGLADKLAGRTLPGEEGCEIQVRREPIGVCAALLSWNCPFISLAWKMAPALAAGCTVVVKTSERAPLSAQYLATLIQVAGFPKGVVNILCGGQETGRFLVSNSRIDTITFTGTVATAQDILRASLPHLPRVTLELGDKTPNVICGDADLDCAIPAAVHAAFHGAGQNCCAGSRILVQQSIFDEVLERMRGLVQMRRLGDQFADDTEQGPQIDRAHVARIDQSVKEAIAGGATCVIGGAPWGDGQFYAPTLFTGLSNSMPMNREEIFGPVATLMPFSDIDEAIALANDRAYGLAAAIWTSNGKTADCFVQQVRAGTCWINCYEYLDPGARLCGRKLSGVGRELGLEGIEPFLETKTVVRQC